MRPEPGKRTDKTSRNTARGSYTISEFASLGIAGLQSTNTVGLYVQAWLDTHNGEYPQPGKTVVLDDGQTTDPNGYLRLK